MYSSIIAWPTYIYILYNIIIIIFIIIIIITIIIIINIIIIITIIIIIIIIIIIALNYYLLLLFTIVKHETKCWQNVDKTNFPSVLRLRVCSPAPQKSFPGTSHADVPERNRGAVRSVKLWGTG